MNKEDLYSLKIEEYTHSIQELFFKTKDGKLDPNDISLPDIVEKYLSYIMLLRSEDIDIDMVANFLFFVSNLIYWKSNLIVPAYQKEPEGLLEDDIDGSNEDYWKEYQKYHSLVPILEDSQLKQRDIYFACVHSKIENEENYQENHFSDLIYAMESILSKKENQNTIHLTKREYNITQKMKEIEQKFQEYQGKLRFKEIISEDCPRLEIIIIFLAFLELICKGKVDYYQSENFGEIIFYRKEVKNKKQRR